MTDRWITLNDIHFRAADVLAVVACDEGRTASVTLRDGDERVTHFTRTPYATVVAALTPPHAAPAPDPDEPDRNGWPGVKTWFGDALYQAGDDGPDGRPGLLAREGDDLHSRTLRADQRQRVVARCRELAARRDEPDVSDIPEAGENWFAQAELRYPRSAHDGPEWADPGAIRAAWETADPDDPSRVNVTAVAESAAPREPYLPSMTPDDAETLARGLYMELADGDPRLPWKDLRPVQRMRHRRAVVALRDRLLGANASVAAAAVYSARRAGLLDDMIVGDEDDTGS